MSYLISRRRVGGTVSTFFGMVSFRTPSVYNEMPVATGPLLELSGGYHLPTMSKRCYDHGSKLFVKKRGWHCTNRRIMTEQEFESFENRSG